MSNDGFRDMSDELLDLQQIEDDERLLSALAAGQTPLDVAAADRELAALLGNWRSELESSAAAMPPFDAAPLEPAAPIRPRPARGRRAAVAAAAGLVTVLGMTGTAAAISGQHGPFAPLHRVIFGAPTAHSTADPLELRARSLLKEAAGRISATASAGHVSNADRAAIGAMIDAASQLLRQDPQAPKSLVQQAESLRTELAKIPGEPKVSPSPSPAIAPTTAPSLNEPSPAAPPVVQPPAVPSAPGEPEHAPDGVPTAEPTEPETDVSEPARPSASPSAPTSHESSDDSSRVTDGAENLSDR